MRAVFPRAGRRVLGPVRLLGPCLAHYPRRMRGALAVLPAAAALLARLSGRAGAAAAGHCPLGSPADLLCAASTRGRRALNGSPCTRRPAVAHRAAAPPHGRRARQRRRAAEAAHHERDAARGGLCRQPHPVPPPAAHRARARAAVPRHGPLCAAHRAARLRRRRICQGPRGLRKGCFFGLCMAGRLVALYPHLLQSTEAT